MLLLRKSIARRASLAVAAGLATAFAAQQFGCSSTSQSQGTGTPARSAANQPLPADQTGSLGMALTLPGGETLSTINWVITGPNGATGRRSAGFPRP